MGISVKFRPSPQFDRSLIDYLVANFEEVQNALLHVQGRIEFNRNWAPGPYKVDIPITVPFRADVYLYCRTTFYNLGVGMQGPIPYWDGVGLSMWHDMYTNEANSYKQCTGTNIVLNADAGIHTFSLDLGYNMGRHANDRIGWGATFYAVF